MSKVADNRLQTMEVLAHAPPQKQVLFDVTFIKILRQIKGKDRK